MPTALSSHLGVVLANRPQSLLSNSEKENRTSVGKTGNQLYSLWIFSLSNPQYQKSLSRNYPQKQGNSVKNGRYVQAILAAWQEPFCVELMKRLNIQRKQDYLSDITLVSRDNIEFKAHRNVLSTASPFFDKLLRSNMKENRKGIVRLEEILGSVLKDVLEFIYTGTVDVTQENAEELIAAGNYMIMPSLKTISGRFLEREMSSINCISTFYLAEKYECDDLITNSRRFIHENIVSVAKLDEFLHLEAKEIEKWISSDEITVKEEADVFRIILDWINHRRSERKTAFEELFRHVRLSFLSRDSLKDVVTNELVRENFACVKLVMDATAQMSSFVNEDDFLQSPRRCLDTRAIVVRGGKYTFCYIPREDLWKRLPDGLKDENDWNNRMIKFRNQLLTFTEDQISERYDPIFNIWSELNLRKDRAKFAVLKGEIYAVRVDYYCTRTVTERYNVKRYAWETIHPHHELCRWDACVIAAGSHLYAFGGNIPRSSEYVAIAERFDTVENKWERIADMLEGRSYAFGVASREKIFVAGGENMTGRLKTCEMYNTLTNEWHLVANLKVPRCHGSMVCLNGKLYVLGGTRSELSVECFDPANDQWIQETTIPVTNIDPENNDIFTGSVLKLSRELLDKLMIVEQ